MRRCDPVTVVTAPHIPDLIALAATLRGLSGEPESKPWPGTRRTYPPTQSTTEGKRMSAPEPLYRADIERNAREEVRVCLEAYQGRFVLDVRIWEDFKIGSVRGRGPTKKGAAIDARKIPELIAALKGAEAEAIRLGLVEASA